MDNIDLKTLGQAIRARRKELNFTQSELAKLLNISQGYIADIENGNVENPSLGKLRKIAKGLQIDLVKLLAESTKRKNKIHLTNEEKEFAFHVSFYYNINILSL